MDKVKSKEEIISEVFDRDEFCMADIPIMDYQKDAVYAAMETYATQQSRIDAIGFAKWVTGTINPIYICNGNGTWEVIKPSPTPQPKEFISDEALYELYLLSINKK